MPVHIYNEIAAFNESGLVAELLLALVGIHGDVFVDPSDTREETDEEANSLPPVEECSIYISPEVTWISESDRAVLADLLRLGYHFKAVSAFVAMEQLPWEHGRAAGQQSVYLQALASGLTELLDDYRCAVLELQLQLEQQPQAPVLATIRHRMWEYMDLLPHLHKLVGEQAAAAVGPLQHRGAALINTLHGGTRCGLPAVRQAMARLLWHCNQVLMQQLAAWTLHGMLQDPNREFFIQMQQQHQQQQPLPGAQQQQAGTGAAGEAAGAGGASGGVAASRDRRTSVDGLGLGAGMGGVGAAAAGSLGPTAQAAAMAVGPGDGGRADEEEAYEEWHSSYQVVAKCLPFYVSPDLASTVLFVGRAVRVLRRPAGGAGGGGRELLPLHDMMQFAQAFTQLQSEPELSAARLEMLVEALRQHVARLLWRLLVGRAGLLPCLLALKHYCLMARGDFWQTFLAEARPILNAPPRPNSVDADLAVPFSQSAAKSSAEGDPLLAAFSIKYLRQREADAAFQVSVKTGPAGSHHVPELDRAWDPLVLDVRLPWPLGLLLGREQIRKYNQLFALLLRLKRLTLALDDAWRDLQGMDRTLRQRRLEERRGTAAAGPAGPGVGVAQLQRGLRQLRELRNNMSYILTNLQIYIQTDVIEVNFGLLENKIATCQDFSELERAHSLYLSTLMNHSFLTYKSHCSILQNIFRDVSMLCMLVSRAGCDPHRLDFGAVGRLQESFLREAQAMYSNMKSQRVMESFRSPHLQQLVTRLNFNEYFDKSGK